MILSSAVRGIVKLDDGAGLRTCKKRKHSYRPPAHEEKAKCAGGGDRWAKAHVDRGQRLPLFNCSGGDLLAHCLTPDRNARGTSGDRRHRCRRPAHRHGNRRGHQSRHHVGAVAVLCSNELGSSSSYAFRHHRNISDTSIHRTAFGMFTTIHGRDRYHGSGRGTPVNLRGCAFAPSTVWGFGRFRWPRHAVPPPTAAPLRATPSLRDGV